MTCCIARGATCLAISNFGEKTLEEVYASLENIGFRRELCRV